MNTTPGKPLMNAVRGALIMKGTTLAHWCDANGFKRQNARLVLLGTWDGPKGRAWREKMMRDAGLLEAQP